MKKIYFLTVFIFFLSCKKNKPDEVSLKTNIEFKNILVLGNSITIHPAVPAIEWHGNWGMAASSPDRDYVHILARQLQATIKPVNLSAWENNHNSFDLKAIDVYLNTKPDLILVRLGENINELQHLKIDFQALIEYLQNQSVHSKILITGRFWKNDAVDEILSQVALDHKLPFVKLSQWDVTGNISYLGAMVQAEDGHNYLVTNPDIASHPGDTGMAKIAESIVLGIQKIQ